MKNLIKGNVLIKNVSSGSSGDLTSTLSLTAGETLVAGDWVYLKSDGKVWKTNASAEATSVGLVGVVTTGASVEGTAVVQIAGEWTTTGLTTGAVYYLASGSSAITVTAPSGVESVVRVVGVAQSTTVLRLMVDATWVENTPTTIETNKQTGTTYTLALADAGKIVECANAAPVAVTIPLNATVAFPVGAVLDIVQTGAGLVTVGIPTGGFINGVEELGGDEASLTTEGQWKAVSLYQDAANSWRVIGGVAV